MNTNKIFNIKRFLYLFQKEFHLNIKRNLLIIGAMYSIYTIVMFLVFQFGEIEATDNFLKEFHFWTFTLMLFIGGVFITSLSFIELRNKLKAHFYILIPGSSFEKFITNLIISFFGYVLFMIISYIAYSTIFNWVVYRAYELNFVPFTIRNQEFIIAMQIFLLVHSLFFLGAASFKKFPVIFTPIVFFLLIMILTLTNEVTENILYPNKEFEDFIAAGDLEGLIQFLKVTSKIIVLYILPPILWFVTYLKLNEKEC